MKEEVILVQKLLELDPSKVEMEYSIPEFYGAEGILSVQLGGSWINVTLKEDSIKLGSSNIDITKEEYLTLSLAFEKFKKRYLQAQKEKIALLIKEASKPEEETLLDIDYGE